MIPFTSKGDLSTSEAFILIQQVSQAHNNLHYQQQTRIFVYFTL